MTTIQDIYHFIDQIAPFAIQESWDNSGMLVGHWKQAVSQILITLDITPKVILEAKNMGAELIVSHHPLLFDPANKVTDGKEDLVGQRILTLSENGIAAICCHTNWDSAKGGVNYVLAKLCGLGHLQVLEPCGVDEQGVPYGVGRVGTLAIPIPLSDYLEMLKGSLEPNGMRYVDAGKRVYRVAVGGGSCGSMMHQVLKAGCDTFVTGDLKYDHFLDAQMLGLNVIDAGHYPTEDPAMSILGRQIAKEFPDILIKKTESHHEVLRYKK